MNNGITILEIVKNLNRTFKKKKKETENIRKNKKKMAWRGCKKDFRNFERQISKKSGLVSKKMFEADVTNVNKRENM